MHNKIGLRLKTGNGCYFTMACQFKSKLLTNKIEKNLYTTYLRPVVSYTCSAWATTASYEERLNIFKKKVLRKMYGPVHNSDT